MRRCKVPVIFFFFNRMDTALKAFEAIKKVRPEKLYLVSDGPREGKAGEAEAVKELRKCIEEQIDFPCMVQKNYAESNLGCGKRIAGGISWVFEQEEEAIILEDDIVALPEFFYFCEELLIKYKNDGRIMYISGNKLNQEYTTQYSYLFTKYPSAWGWATWKRAWDLYDDSPAMWEKVKSSGAVERFYGRKWGRAYGPQLEKAYRGVDVWDYQWEAARMYYGAFGIVPKYNLIDNVGFNHVQSTHTSGDSMYDFTTHPISFPLQHPSQVSVDGMHDQLYLKNIISREFERFYFWGKVKRRLRIYLKGERK